MTTCPPGPPAAKNTTQTPAAASRRPAGRGPNALHRLVQITRSNDRLAVELAKSRRRLERALEYATDAKSNGTLAVALVAHCYKKHISLVEQLRANRSEAIAILSGSSAGA